jgi:hypothetical protein
MADIRPSKINFFKIIYLCFLAIISPKNFIKEEEKDNTLRANFPPAPEKKPRIYSIRKAFWYSLGLIILSACVGCLTGLLLRYYLASPSVSLIVLLQSIGACLLLWGTLFIRGWEIQTFCGVTLTERVNQWIYRFLYCIGTSIIICSLFWNIPIRSN